MILLKTCFLCLRLNYFMGNLQFVSWDKTTNPISFFCSLWRILLRKWIHNIFTELKSARFYCIILQKLLHFGKITDLIWIYVFSFNQGRDEKLLLYFCNMHWQVLVGYMLHLDWNEAWSGLRQILDNSPQADDFSMQLHWILFQSMGLKGNVF